MTHAWVSYAAPVVFAVFAWWGSTALIFYLNSLPRRTVGISMLVGSMLAGLSIPALALASRQTSVLSDYLAFICVLTLWGWLQMSFYMGVVTGPRRVGATRAGWPHFFDAVMAGLYHDIMALVLGAVVVATSWDAPNRVGVMSFVILWCMHLSARLNLFLGVANLNVEFLPPHMDFIRPYLTSRPMNMLFPLSISMGGLASLVFAERAYAAGVTVADSVGDVLCSTMLFLGLLEHWFLVLPLPAVRSWNKLWQWALRSGARHGVASLGRWSGSLAGDAKAAKLSSSLLPSANWNRK